ncbi:MAG: TetR/AcrR family transcriptional regulator [Firmicutes bacterium]|nr:TetR/AcrR family transcriptional regulator [Bacillota bacterium]
MEQEFKRAKSKENKQIRLQQIMDITDKLFHETTYHQVTLSVIAKEMGMARGGLYKYVSSVEDIFLMIYLQKQKKMIEEVLNSLKDKEITVDIFSEIWSQCILNNIDLIKYHQILNAIIETNTTLDMLVEFKKTSNKDQKPLFQVIESLTGYDQPKIFDIYLAIIYHCVYLYDRVFFQDRYVEAMKMANLDIIEIDFVSECSSFIKTYMKR